jgi:hypothetical protein
LTPPDVVTSRQAVLASERGDYESWFKEDFRQKTVLYQWAAKWSSCQRYYASLWFCRSQAFLLCAREVCKQNSVFSNSAQSETVLMFQQLRIPKVYCWGGGMSEQSTKLVNENLINTWGFEDAFHWPMIDKEREFYHLLEQFNLAIKIM